MCFLPPLLRKGKSVLVFTRGSGGTGQFTKWLQRQGLEETQNIRWWERKTTRRSKSWLIPSPPHLGEGRGASQQQAGKGFGPPESA